MTPYPQRLANHLAANPVTRGRPADVLFRTATALLLARNERRSFEQIVADRYPGDNTVLKSAVAPADTTTSAWAGVLGSTVTADIVALLSPMSASARLLSAGLSLSFDGAAAISVPRYAAAAANIGFVQEGAPHPVKKFDLSGGAILVPRQLAGDVVFT